MNLETTKIYHSTLPEYSDATFVLRRATEGRRVKIQMELANARSRVRDMLAELETLKPAEGVEADPKTNARISTLSDEIGGIISSEISPAWIRWGLAGIEHLTFDTTPADVESFLVLAPSDLFKEILEAIQVEAALSQKKDQNSQ